MPTETAREIRSRARNLAWERIAPAESFDRNASQEAIRISDTIAHIQEDLQEKARLAQSARNEFVAEKAHDAEQGKASIELTSREDRETFVQSVIASLPPEEAKKLAALDRYAAETREAIYRGFEAVDAERHALELSRAQSEPRQDESLGTLRSLEIQSPNSPVYFTRPNQFEPRIPTHAQASAEQRDRAGDFQRDRPETNFPQGYVDSDREWHFDGLRDVLKSERVNGDDQNREYMNRIDEQSRIYDR